MFTKKYINKIGSKIKHGSLRVVFPNNEEFLFNGKNGLHGELILKSYKPIFLKRILSKQPKGIVSTSINSLPVFNVLNLLLPTLKLEDNASAILDAKIEEELRQFR